MSATNQQDYHSTITVTIGAGEVFEKIHRVSDWWTASFQGNSRELGDVFTVRWGETFVDFKIIEIIPDKRIVWLVTDCNLNWLKDRKEWKDTRIAWDVSAGDRETRVTMTHVGLTPEVECYRDCVSGWNFYIQESLLKFLIENKGLPDKQRRT